MYVAIFTAAVVQSNCAAFPEMHGQKGSLNSAQQTYVGVEYKLAAQDLHVYRHRHPASVLTRLNYIPAEGKIQQLESVLRVADAARITKLRTS